MWSGRRRDVLGWGAAIAAGARVHDAWGASRPAVLGVMSGDPHPSSSWVWALTDRPARLWVEWSHRPDFSDLRRVLGGNALPETGYAAKAFLRDLPRGRPVHYRVRFEDLSDLKTSSARVPGRLRTGARRPGSVRIGWGGDVAGQGYGIDLERGGYRTFETLAKMELDVFVHSGDHVYADGPLEETKILDDGSQWRNLVTPAKAKVAETLDEFRGQYAYNLLDPHFRNFFAQTSMIPQWDDHETINNWYPGEQILDDRYRVRDASLLAARSRLAFEQMMPIPPSSQPGLHRSVRLGPEAEVFVLDARSFRGPNRPGRGGPEDFFGSEQLRWLKAALQNSTSTWKILATDIPMGLVVPDGNENQEGLANGLAAVGGREHELLGLLRFAKTRKIRNLVFITADVHYAAAHHYHPDRARVDGFDPFWEWVAGPLHAGTFGPNELDPSFGPEVRFRSRAPGAPVNLSPAAGAQYFGVLDVTRDDLTARLHDQAGRLLFEHTSTPA